MARIHLVAALLLAAQLTACGSSQSVGESPDGEPPQNPGSGARSSLLAGNTMSGQAIPCATREDGLRVCIGDMNNGPDGSDIRFRSFDGQPLFLIVTLPAAPASGPDGDYPFVVQSHGWGAPPTSPDDRQYGGPTALEWAREGYAVMQFAARGWGNSCGTPQSRLLNPAACLRGYVRMVDYRYEVRDVQTAVGLLVDEGLVDPERVGVNGESYGGGTSLSLATLNNRIMDVDGSLKPWTSPDGRPLRIAAAAPMAGWSDLAYSVAPNGRTLDTEITPIEADLSPIGVMKLTIDTGLYLTGHVNLGYYATPGTDPEADQTTWSALLTAGEPYDTPLLQEAVRQYTQYRSPYYLLAGAYGLEQAEPAPLLLSNGFTDDVFGADEYVRYYNLHQSLYPDAPISLFFFDGGHQRGNNKVVDTEVRLASRIKAFFDHYVKGTGPRPPQNVIAFAQTCPIDVPSLGPFTADTWAALHPGEVVHSSAPEKTVLSIGGNPLVGLAFDPVAGGLACATAAGEEEGLGVASYALPTPTGAGYTLLGSPTVTADLTVTGLFAYVAARLVDVDPATNTKTLIARGLYRIDPDAPNGRQTFQLHANGWHFAPGHIPRLELLGQDLPYARPSNGVFSIAVSNLELRLPVHEVPGAPGTPAEVTAPAQ